MDYETLIKETKVALPEFAAAYDKEVEKDNIDLVPGPHTVFSLVFVPMLKKAIMEDEALTRRMCSFLEKMECSGNSDVAEVVEFTVLEELCDNYHDAEFANYLGPETKLALKAIRGYIPEQ